MVGRPSRSRDDDSNTNGAVGQGAERIAAGRTREAFQKSETDRRDGRWTPYAEREFWSTRQYLWNGTVSGWMWAEERFFEFGEQLRTYRTWHTVGLAGIIGLVLTLGLFAATTRDPLTRVVIPSPDVQPRYPRLPEFIDPSIDSRIRPRRQIPRVAYDAEFPKAKFAFASQSRPAPRREPAPRPRPEPVVREFEAPPIGPSELELSVSWRHWTRPGRLTIDPPIVLGTGSSESTLSKQELDGLLANSDPNWKRGGSRPATTFQSRGAYQDVSGQGERLNRVTDVVPDSEPGEPVSMLASSAQLAVDLEAFVPRAASVGASNRTALQVTNRSTTGNDLVVSVDEPTGELPVVEGTNPLAAINETFLNRRINPLRPGDSQRLELDWFAEIASPYRYRGIVTVAGSVSAATVVDSMAEVVSEPVADTPAFEDIPERQLRPALEMSIRSVGMVRIGEQVSVDIEVVNTGEVELPDVRILADLSDKVRHRYGQVLEFRVGKLVVGEARTTYLLLEGLKTGKTQNQLRAVAFEAGAATTASPWAESRGLVAEVTVEAAKEQSQLINDPNVLAAGVEATAKPLMPTSPPARSEKSVEPAAPPAVVKKNEAASVTPEVPNRGAAPAAVKMVPCEIRWIPVVPCY